MIDNDELEASLARSLAVDAQRAPAPVVAAQWAAPRRRRMRTRRLAVRFAAVAVVTGGVTSELLLGGGSQAAYASWRSVPDQVSSATVTAITQACSSDAGQRTVTGTDGQDLTPHFADPLVVDVRGHDAYAVAVDGTHVVDCMTTIPGESNDGLPVGVDGWLNFSDLRDTALAVPTAGNPLTVISAKAPAGNMVSRYDVTWVAGRIDRGVTRVVITTPTGTIVPTITNGTFAAWWPGNDGDKTTITAYSSNGSTVAIADNLTCPSPRLHVSGQPSSGGCLGDA